MDKKEEIYKQRQAIVEPAYLQLMAGRHPYGTMKRQWGFDHVMTKQYKERASADIGLIMSAYNLRRLFNILTFTQLFEILIKIDNKVKKWLLESLRSMIARILTLIIKRNQFTGLRNVWRLSHKLEWSF